MRIIVIMITPKCSLNPLKVTFLHIQACNVHECGSELVFFSLPLNAALDGTPTPRYSKARATVEGKGRSSQ